MVLQSIETAMFMAMNAEVVFVFYYAVGVWLIRLQEKKMDALGNCYIVEEVGVFT